MDRVLFDVGARGQLIVDLQTSLSGRGFDPKGQDGVYGRDTAAAVRDYQAGAGRPATGAVAIAEWSGITNTPVPPLESRALQLTSTFEGHGFSLAAGNWDGAWLTWGIIGFTLKSGEIQSIVSSVAQQDPSAIDEAFGDDAAQLRHIVNATAAEQQAWATSITAGTRLVEPWQTHFRQFGALAVVQREQCARVHTDYFVPALSTAAALGLVSELGVALCFDIHVQNGGVSAATRDAVVQQTAGAPEAAVREALANAVADHAKPQFQEDVRQRKLAIARGAGVVHGLSVVLASWGLADVPAVVV